MWFYGFIVSSSDDPFYIYTLVHVPPPTYLRPPSFLPKWAIIVSLVIFEKKDIDKSDSNSWPSNGQGLAHEAFLPAWICRVSMSHIFEFICQTAVIGTIWTRGTKKTYSVNMLLYSTAIKCRNTRSIYSVTLLRLSTKLHKIRSLALNKWPSCQAISFKRNHSHESIEIYTCFYYLLYWLNTKRLHLALKHTHSPSKSCRSLP